jgi:preprotein translocase subunit SecA
MFQDMLGRLREGVTQLLSHIEIQVNVPDAIPEPRSPQSVEAQHTTVGQFGDATPRADETGAGAASARSQATATIDPEDPSTWGKVPRNAPCPCGTGKKYKHCHGRSA